ncbi:MAG: OmpA family protein [Epsilonproteobacteria bacterium]|nr:OmpA family protein [Campylobacterota bacterium]
MKKRLMMAVGIVGFLVGCGSQPSLQSSQEQNNSAQQAVSQAQPVETDLTDNTVVNVAKDSVTQQNINQKLASALSQNVVHFDFDKYNIKQSQLPIVQNVANLIKDTKGNFTVRIEGNCDEWGSDEYNYALGLKRAKTVKQALIDLGVDAKKLAIISYGESNPVCTAHTKECWAKNRRDNFTLLP